jgi:threonine efflux protein
MANPKAAIYFGSIFANFIGPTTTAASKALIFACVALESLLWFLLVATLFSSPWMQRFYSRAQLWIDRVAGVAFVLLGLKLISALKQ